MRQGFLRIARDNFFLTCVKVYLILQICYIMGSDDGAVQGQVWDIFRYLRDILVKLCHWRRVFNVILIYISAY